MGRGLRKWDVGVVVVGRNVAVEIWLVYTCVAMECTLLVCFFGARRFLLFLYPPLVRGFCYSSISYRRCSSIPCPSCTLQYSTRRMEIGR